MTGPAACGLVALVGLLPLLRKRGELAGTTLMAVWCWSGGSLLAVALAAAWATGSSVSELMRVRLLYAAAATTFCPLMALLGARRPQHRAWQLVVVTLLVVLLLPAGEAFLYEPRSRFLLHPAWGWFLWLLIGFGLVNRLGTRHWPSGASWALGQMLLLGNQLPIVSQRLTMPLPLAGLLALAVGAALWGLDLPRRARRPSGWSGVWLDFRDGFGTLWALRLRERFNAAAELAPWDVRLHWHGLAKATDRSHDTARGDLAAGSLAAGAQTSLMGFLRRFVSQQWINQRLRCPDEGVPLD